MTTAAPDNLATLPEPGVYPDVPFADYRAWDALSKSTLEYGMVSMLHLRAATEGRLQRSDTEALAFGRALHTRLLEPARFKEAYRVIPVALTSDIPGDRPTTTKEYKRRVSTFRQVHEGCEFLSESDGAQLEAMARAVYAHPGVAMLRESGGCEVSITWRHSTGLRLKGRLDKFTRFQGLPTIVDIKGVRTCEPDALSKQIHDLGWHRQGAMYVDGIRELTGELADFILICVEKTYPFGVAVRQVGERSMDLGRRQLLTVLQRWRWCQQRGVFDGFGDDIEQIDVPEWVLRREQQAEELA